MNNIKVDPNSLWYPYQKVYPGYYDLTQAHLIPRKVIDYLLDMPDGYYTPPDNNKHPRSLLWKYLYYDGAHPEQQPLPTPQQKMSVLFNPDNPTQPTEKGYRLIPQKYIKPAQTEAQTRIYVYMGRTIATSDNEVQLSVVFDIYTHYTEQANSRVDDSYSRVDLISDLIIYALHGIAIIGVGGFYFNRARHPDCGSTPFDDGHDNVGRRLVLGVSVKSETSNSNNPANSYVNNNGISLA